MSKAGYISRYLLIIKKLKQKPYTSKPELIKFIENQFEFLQEGDEMIKGAFSERTIERDFREMRRLFGIDIEYSKTHKGYFIEPSENSSVPFQRMLEAFDVFNVTSLTHGLDKFIYPENKKPQGTENLHGLAHAIQNTLQIKFTYQKFWEDAPTHREAHPYALKEFRNRWYLIAKDLGDKKIKTFALDRLSNLDISRSDFFFPKDFNAEEIFRDSFGMITPTDSTVQNIILSFNPVQGNYIRTLPLHHSQKILVDDDDELRISLKLFITDDLIMELLSHSDKVKVIEPKLLADTIKDEHERAYKQY